jgi:hypothetical protein
MRCFPLPYLFGSIASPPPGFCATCLFLVCPMIVSTFVDSIRVHANRLFCQRTNKLTSTLSPTTPTPIRLQYLEYGTQEFRGSHICKQLRKSDVYKDGFICIRSADIEPSDITRYLGMVASSMHYRRFTAVLPLPNFPMPSIHEPSNIFRWHRLPLFPLITLP